METKPVNLHQVPNPRPILGHSRYYRMCYVKSSHTEGLWKVSRLGRGQDIHPRSPCKVRSNCTITATRNKKPSQEKRAECFNKLSLSSATWPNAAQEVRIREQSSQEGASTWNWTLILPAAWAGGNERRTPFAPLFL